METNQKITEPTPEMFEWYKEETEHMQDWDELDRDPAMDTVRNCFYGRFEKELEGVDADEIFYKLY